MEPDSPNTDLLADAKLAAAQLEKARLEKLNTGSDAEIDAEATEAYAAEAAAQQASEVTSQTDQA